ncbi:peptidylprolyl isomerase [Lyngbya confervoides]|uniref:peptidylprolyl isomerase n=1 Tax=Lyngbya confervoides BDU141951 TaxID=1574623 RepID=A0ABD4T4L2_9CYAN|nr:peptidylprolyl isomerase [Lyngbya confervoides]MCM1983604.1 peptidylprolyl isomerase [Lyngbya confervoides BDU141951]
MIAQLLNIQASDLMEEAQLSCQIPGLITGILTRKIITDQAQALNISVSDAELQEAADHIRLAEKLQKAEDTYAWLKKHHLSVDQFEQLAAGNVLSTKLAQHLFGDRVEAYFAEHQLDYYEATLSEVLINDLDLALELFFSLQEQEISFFEVAQAHIQDPDLRHMGGYRGRQSRFSLRPEVSSAVFSAQAHQILKPIVSSLGVHLVQVHEIFEPSLTAEVRNQIVSTLFLDWINQEIEQLQPHVDFQF